MQRIWNTPFAGNVIADICWNFYEDLTEVVLRKHSISAAVFFHNSLLNPTESNEKIKQPRNEQRMLFT